MILPGRDYTVRSPSNPLAEQEEQGRSLTNAPQPRQGIADFAIGGIGAAAGSCYLALSGPATGATAGCLVNSEPAMIAFRIWLKMSVSVLGVCGIKIVLV